MYLLIPAFCLTFFFNSCTRENEEEIIANNQYQTVPYHIRVPSGWPEPSIPDFNQTTVEGVRLGRMLFYDPILSSNGLTCSSCHPQDRAFAVPFRINSRNEVVSIPPIMNLAFNPDWGWKGQDLVLDHLPLTDFSPEFFNTNMDTLVSRIKKHNLYPLYFREAFGIGDVANISHSELQHKISYALIQFVRTVISDNSKFDKVMRREAAFSPEELSGANIFFTEKGDCFHCHGTPLFTNNTFNNTGLDSILSGQNLGRYLFTGLNSDKGKFSSPSLRNIELTAPYMHDSRFNTLEEVVEFYNSGVRWNSPNIDPVMTKPFKEYGLNLTPSEKSDLISFLKTLTDTSFLTNPDYANPF